MKYQAFVDISRASSIDAFRNGLVSFAHELEFGQVSAMLMVDRPGGKPAQMAVTNMPQSYEAIFHDADSGRRDPVLKRLRHTNVPFAYDQSLYVREDAADLWEEQAPFGYKTGISVALHLPDGIHFLLGVDREAPLPDDDEALTRLFATLQLLAVHAQHAAMGLLTPEQPAAEAPRLTPRERECLRWTMAGKTAGEAAQILGITQRTAEFHLHAVLRKFGCTNKHQAVLMALRWNLI